jgi:hypothetical protein
MIKEKPLVNYDSVTNLYKLYYKFDDDLDPVHRLINKNTSVNDDFLYDKVKESELEYLKNCNFVETTVSKLYENKIISPSKNYSNRRLKALSPDIEYKRELFDNDDKLNDFFEEKDLKHDEKKIIMLNADYNYLRYMATRGPDNAEGGFHDWGNDITISDNKYKFSNSINIDANLRNTNTDHLNDVDKKIKKINNSNINKNTKNKYQLMIGEDIKFSDAQDTYTGKSLINQSKHYKNYDMNIGNNDSYNASNRELKFRTDNGEMLRAGVTDNKLNVVRSENEITHNKELKKYDIHHNKLIKYAITDIINNDINESEIKKNEPNINNVMKEFKISFDTDKQLKHDKEINIFIKSPNYNTFKQKIKSIIMDHSGKQSQLENNIKTPAQKIDTDFNGKIYEITNDFTSTFVKSDKFTDMGNKNKNILLENNKKYFSTDTKLFNYTEYLNSSKKSGMFDDLHNNMSRNLNRVSNDDFNYDESIENKNTGKNTFIPNNKRNNFLHTIKNNDIDFSIYS